MNSYKPILKLGNRIDDSLLVELKLLLDAKHIQPIKIENSMVNWNEIIFKKKTIKVFFLHQFKLSNEFFF